MNFNDITHIWSFWRFSCYIYVCLELRVRRYLSIFFRINLFSFRFTQLMFWDRIIAGETRLRRSRLADRGSYDLLIEKLKKNEKSERLRWEVFSFRSRQFQIAAITNIFSNRGSFILRQYKNESFDPGCCTNCHTR